MIGTTIISCGHKATSPHYSWTQFKTAVSKEKAINIVNITKPINWTNNPIASEVSIINSKIDENNFNIKLDINRVSNDLHSTASFEIDYTNNQKYDIEDWHCTSEPSFTEWSIFKMAALQVTAINLLKVISDTGQINTFKWTYGTPSQIAWVGKDSPEFDTYGSLTANDAYKGMQGAPIASDSAKTITAIISKKGKKGAYDSDPIKAIIHYQAGTKYQISDWKFSQVEQLQSWEKFNNIFTHQLELTNNWGSFNAVNWMTANGHNGNSHSESIDTILNETGYSNHEPLIMKSHQIDKTKPKEITMEIVFKFLASNQANELSLLINFQYANQKDSSAGGSVFSYTWEGIVH